MEPIQINDPEVISLTFTIVKLLLGGILLGLLFYFSKYALSLFPGDIANNKTLNRIILFTKLASWSVFIIYAVEQIFYNYPMAGRIATVILLFMVIGISWQIIREFILGVLVKFEGSYPVNRRVKIKKIEGKIKSLGSRHMVIETEKGESLHIPYSLIQKNLQFRSQSDSIFKSHTFELELPNSIIFEEYHRIISAVLCNCHWVSLTKDPIINLINEDQESLRLQITTYPVDEKHKVTIENLLKSKLAEYSRPQENQSQVVD
jgi:hypothetical protein